MRRFSERHSLSTLSELNVTPLLDLAFVLLIIFMITTPLMDNSVDLVIPSSEAAPKSVDPSAVQTISINRDALVKLNGALKTVAQLEAELIALKGARSEVAVVIRAHKELPVQQLINVMDAVQRAKIGKVGVVTTPDNPERPVKSDLVFRRNLLIVAALHVAFVAALFFVAKFSRKPAVDQITWLDGGSIGGGEPDEGTSEPAVPETVPPQVPQPPLPEPEPPKPTLIKPPSEIPLCTPEPVPPKPVTPKPATPKPQTPKPAPPKPATPKPATAKPTTPKTKATPNADASAKVKATPSDKPKGTPGGAKSTATAGTPGAKSGGNGAGTGNGKGPGKAGGGTGASEFGWYLQMIDAKLRPRWVQPTDIQRGGADVVTLLKLRISADGTITAREIVKESGYAQMDESVLRAAEKVTQLDPLPAGLGTGGVFEVNVQFKLDQGQ